MGFVAGFAAGFFFAPEVVLGGDLGFPDAELFVMDEVVLVLVDVVVRDFTFGDEESGALFVLG